MHNTLMIFFSNKIIVPANTIQIRLTQSILLVCENVIV